MQRPWEEDFDFYLSRMGKDPVAVLVDLGAGPHLPDPDLNVRVRVLLHLREPGADGLVTAEERPRLYEATDRLAAAVGEGLGGVLVGRVMVQGLADLVFYAPGTAVGQIDELRRMVDGVREEYDVDLDVAPDISWQFYREVLWPDAYEHQFILNNRVLRQLEQAGDDPTCARPVDHLVFLPDRERARTAAEQLRALGFDIPEPEAEEDGSFRIAFQGETALDDGAIHEHVASILGVVLPLEGSYDGWGCAVIGGDRPA